MEGKGFNPPPKFPSFDKAEPNFQFRGICCAPPPEKIPGYATVYTLLFSFLGEVFPFIIKVSADMRCVGV
jgi:hypothetical protein